MENDSTYNINLITRYFAAEANEQEMFLLLDWIKANPENQKIFDEYHQTWLNLEKAKIEKFVNIDEEWNEIGLKTIKKKNQTKIISLNTERSHNSFIKILKYAAVFVFFAVSAVAMYYYLNKPKVIQLAAKIDVIESKLPDGTSVTLNTGSTLEYPKEFEKDKRSVKLKGEAYFNVSHDAAKPFIIAADNIMIEVLGTTFYVNTNNTNGKVEVILTNGRVAVYHKDKPNERVILEPGEKIELSKNIEEYSKTINEDENYLAWKTKKMIFTDEPLTEIVQTLNKVYHSNIQLKNNNIANCKITATFDNQSLDAVLNVIEATVDVKIDKTSEKIEISGIGCK